jgi:hypothetical protein
MRKYLYIIIIGSLWSQTTQSQNLSVEEFIGIRKMSEKSIDSLMMARQFKKRIATENDEFRI